MAMAMVTATGDRRAALVLAQSEGEQEVADVFPIKGKRTRQGAVVGGGLEIAAGLIGGG